MSQNESKVYIGLLRFGHSTIMELSNRIRMNRSTTHVAINSLISKGLVSQTKYGDRRIVIPETPEKIQLLLENEKMNIRRKEENLGSLIENIYGLVNAAKDSTEFVVKYIEGRDAVVSLYDSILESKEIRSYYDYAKLRKLYPENQLKFFNAGQRGTKIWDIISSQEDNSYIDGQKMYEGLKNVRFKRLPKNINLSVMDYLIYDDKIALIYVETKPKAVILSSKLLAGNTRVLFDLLWEFLS